MKTILLLTFSTRAAHFSFHLSFLSKWAKRLATSILLESNIRGPLTKRQVYTEYISVSRPSLAIWFINYLYRSVYPLIIYVYHEIISLSQGIVYYFFLSLTIFFILDSKVQNQGLSTTQHWSTKTNFSLCLPEIVFILLHFYTN